MSAHTQKRTVAVVDDDASVLRALSRLLSTAGYAVQSFTSGGDFLDHFETMQTDCLIVDVQMPGMTGFELLEKLQQMGQPVPVLFITAHDSATSRQQAADLNAGGLLVKPFSPKHLLQRVASLTAPGPMA